MPEPQYLTIQLRPGWKIEIMLPGDLTDDEAERIAKAVKAAARAPMEPEDN